MDRPFNDKRPPSPVQALVDAVPRVPLRRIVRRFWPDLRPYRRWLVVTLLVVALGPAVETATIWLSQRLVDEVVVPGDLGALWPIALAYLGLTLLGGLLYFGDDVLSEWVSQRFLVSLRTRLFRHLQTLPLDFFERRRLGDVLSRLTDDVDEIEGILASGATDAIAYGLQIVFFTAALFFLEWRLALVALVVTPPFWLVAWLVGRRGKEAAREQRRHDGAIVSVAEESLANAQLVQAYNRQATEVGRFEREAFRNFAAQMTLARIRAAFGPLVDLIKLGGMLIVVAVGTWELSRGRISLGGLLAFMVYLRQLYDPVRRLGRLITDAAEAAAGAERIIELLDQRPAVADRPGALVLPAARGAITLDAVSYRYPSAARDALAGVSFRLEPGETLALVGPSGAGKSTVVKLLLRFVDPATGRVLLDGHDLRDLGLASLRDNVAVVLQETLVFDGTVRDNIAYGRSGATEREIVAAAEAADAHDFVTALPDGYDTRIGQRGRSLSGGQRQRLAIARAFIRDAPVLILDEPTTGVDAGSRERILEPLRRLMRGRTTIIVSHDLALAGQADTIAVIEAGRIVERGRHDDLLARGGAYARLCHRGRRPDPAPAPGAVLVDTPLPGAA